MMTLAKTAPYTHPAISFVLGIKPKNLAHPVSSPQYVQHQHPEASSSCMEKWSAMELNTASLINKTEATVERVSWQEASDCPVPLVQQRGCKLHVCQSWDGGPKG